jgi:uncharacterized Zn ribbon protein
MTKNIPTVHCSPKKHREILDYLNSLKDENGKYISGLKKGDIITYVNDVRVKSSPELQEQVALFRPGQKVKVIYLRSGKEFEIEVKLKNAINGTDNVIIERLNQVITCKVCGSDYKYHSKSKHMKTKKHHESVKSGKPYIAITSNFLKRKEQLDTETLERKREYHKQRYIKNKSKVSQKRTN